MVSRRQKPLHHISNEPLQSATVTLILLLCQVPIERSSPSDRMPLVVRGVWPSFEVGPTPLHHSLPHNPGTPRWHAGARDGRAGVGGGG